MSDLVLTQKGKDAVADPTIRGSGVLYLEYLSKNGPSSAEDIGRGLRISDRKSKKMANALGARGYLARDEGD